VLSVAAISFAMAVEAADAETFVSQPRVGRIERDEVYWTELEVRRLGNIVAEMVQARRFCGDTPAAEAERLLMRKRLDAMRRKALRVLHRAELHVNAGQSTWPGLDKSLTQPVNLAEEYVRTVTNYLDVLEEEEERAERAAGDDVDIGGVLAAVKAKARAEAAGRKRSSSLYEEIDGKTLESAGSERTIEEVTAELGEPGEPSIEDISYRDALAREAAKGAQQSRGNLSGSSGIRRRKGEIGNAGDGGGSSTMTGEYSKEDEELMARHQPVQDQLTSDLVDLVGRLKGNLVEINAKIRDDGVVIDETEDVLDQNLSGIGKTREILASFTRSTSMSWWTIWVLLVLVIVTFLGVFVLTKIPI
jgi:hypothetical protein